MMSFRRHLARRVLIWLGFVLSVLFLMMWVVSRFWCVGYQIVDEFADYGNGQLVSRTRQRCITRFGLTLADDCFTQQATLSESQGPASKSGVFGPEVFNWIFRPITGDIYPWWYWESLKPFTVIVSSEGLAPYTFSRRQVYAVRPCWPFFLCAISTALLWWRGRRIWPEGSCDKCGYSLTGNVSGVCPECGTAIPPDVKKALVSEENNQRE
jgi:hypothetical protein